MTYKTYLIKYNERVQQRITKEPERLFTQAEVTNLINCEINTWKQAVWNYITDHTTPSRRGYTVRFFAFSKKNFWWRVECRKNGTFSRTDTQLVANQVEKTIYGQNRQAFFDSQYAVLSKNGPLWFRGVFKIRSLLGDLLLKKVKSGPEWEEFCRRPIFTQS